MRLLVLSCLLVAAAPVLSEIKQAGMKKQESASQRSTEDRVRQNLSKDLDDEDTIRELFGFGDDAVPSLISFLSDPDKERRVGAARGLAYIGNWHGMQALRNAVRSERDKEAKDMMSYSLAGALVDAKSEEDLSFLRNLVEAALSATDTDEAPSAAISASLALALTGEKDSLPLLRRVAKLDTLPADEIQKAVIWIESKPLRTPALVAAPSSRDEDLVKNIVLDGTFFAEAERDKTSVDQLTFNSTRDKVLVSLEIYLGPKSARGYDLVLAKKSGQWRVIGIWFSWIA